MLPSPQGFPIHFFCYAPITLHLTLAIFFFRSHNSTRGAITNGKTWLFLIYRKLQVGGTYAASPPVELGTGAENLPLILGLLRDWLRGSTARFLSRDESTTKFYQIINASSPEIAYFDEV